MSKFKIKFKLTGLEIEIEGSREEIPQISRNLGQQLSGMLAPAAGLVQGEVIDADRRLAAASPSVTSAPAAATPQRKRTGGKKRGKSNGASASPAGAGTAEAVVAFSHDAARFGIPRQTWSTAKKALWLLYAVGEQGGPQELTAQQITATFNKQFREAKQIIVQNVARDLGKMKARPRGRPGLDGYHHGPEPVVSDRGRQARGARTGRPGADPRRGGRRRRRGRRGVANGTRRAPYADRPDLAAA